jgi:hypothetical protein
LCLRRERKYVADCSKKKERKGKENMLQSLVHTLDFFLACGGTAFKFNI